MDLTSNLEFVIKNAAGSFTNVKGRGINQNRRLPKIELWLKHNKNQIAQKLLRKKE